MPPFELTPYPLLDASIRALGVFGVLMSIVPLLIYVERKVCAWIQDRYGPNRVGPFGLLQPLADVIKLLLKEDLRPEGADRWIYTLAPFLVFVPSMLAFAVIPFGMGLQVSNVSLGVIYLITIGGLSVYGIAFGGWASNNKYSMLGGLRSSAQMISYEIALGLSLLPVIMLAESVMPQEIVVDQSGGALGGLLSWNAFRQPFMFLVFAVSAFAETNRLPFDLPECESELVGGYHTEYSSMKFALFFLGEYVAMMTMSALLVTLFLGGWTCPGVEIPETPNGLFVAFSAAVFLLKFGLILFLFIWVRWTLPRFRYDQLMRLGWKVFIPLALANVVVTGFCIVKWGWWFGPQ